MISYDKTTGKMLDHDMAYGPVAPHWINFDEYNSTLEGCLLYLQNRTMPRL